MENLVQPTDLRRVCSATPEYPKPGTNHRKERLAFILHNTTFALRLLYPPRRIPALTHARTHSLNVVFVFQICVLLRTVWLYATVLLTLRSTCSTCPACQSRQHPVRASLHHSIVFTLFLFPRVFFFLSLAIYIYGSVTFPELGPTD